MIDPKALPDNFYLAAAVGVRPYDDLLTMFEIDQEDAEALQSHPVFQQRLLLAKDAVETDGTAFFARCRILAGQTMPAMINLINDTGTPASVQLEAWKSLVKYGRLEPPPPNQQVSSSSGPSLTLTIIAPNGELGFNAEINPAPVGNIYDASSDATEPVALPHYPPEDDDWADPPDLPATRVSAAALGFVV
jgi:hypothetical protein